MPTLLLAALLSPLCSPPPARPSWLPEVRLEAGQQRLGPTSTRDTSDARGGLQRARSVRWIRVALRWSGGARRRVASASCAAALALLPAQLAAQAPPSGDEPTLADVLGAVMAQHEVDRALERRARRSGWAPALVRVEARWDDGARADAETRVTQDFDEVLAPDGTDVRDTSGLWNDRGRMFRIQLGWDLRRVVYHGDEARLAAAARQAEDDLLERLEMATDAWVRWHAAEDALADGDPVVRQQAVWERTRSATELHVLTGGRVSPDGAAR